MTNTYFSHFQIPKIPTQCGFLRSGHVPTLHVLNLSAPILDISFDIDQTEGKTY